MNNISLVGMNKTRLATEFKRVPHSKRANGGMGLNYIIKFLEATQTKIRSSELYRKSPYRFKKTSLEIIKWCLDRKLIEKEIQYKSSFKNRKDPKVFYQITDKGRELLGMIR